MTKKSKQSKRATKHSKRIKVAAEPEDEVDTATTFSRAETPESISVSPQTEEAGGPVESQQAEPTVAPATKAETAPDQLAAMRRRQTSRKDCGYIKSPVAPPKRNLFSLSVKRAIC